MGHWNWRIKHKEPGTRQDDYTVKKDHSTGISVGFKSAAIFLWRYKIRAKSEINSNYPIVWEQHSVSLELTGLSD